VDDGADSRPAKRQQAIWWDLDDWELVKRACDILGKMPLASFVRMAAVAHARRVIDDWERDQRARELAGARRY
jgi:uncharacterized protein (DUF1778 family)